VVEGYTDVLALHQAGITEAVGVMGTEITEEQVAMLSRQTKEVVLALDADRAGQEAMLRAGRKAAAQEMRLRVAAMPEGEDPAQMVGEEGGGDRFRELVDEALELPEFQVRLVLDRTDPASPVERDRALAEVAPVLAAMDEGASQKELERRVSDRLDQDPAIVAARVVAARNEPMQMPAGDAEEEAGQPPSLTLTPRERRERALLAMCIADPKAGEEMLGRLTPEHLSSPLVARTVEWLRGNLEEPLAGLSREDEELDSLVTALVMAAEREPASREAMEMNFLQLEFRRLGDEIAEADAMGDSERRAELSRQHAAVGEQIERPQRLAS